MEKEVELTVKGPVTRRRSGAISTPERVLRPRNEKLEGTPGKLEGTPKRTVTRRISIDNSPMDTLSKSRSTRASSAQPESSTVTKRVSTRRRSSSLQPESPIKETIDETLPLTRSKRRVSSITPDSTVLDSPRTIRTRRSTNLKAQPSPESSDKLASPESVSEVKRTTRRSSNSPSNESPKTIGTIKRTRSSLSKPDSPEPEVSSVDKTPSHIPRRKVIQNLNLSPVEEIHDDISSPGSSKSSVVTPNTVNDMEEKSEHKTPKSSQNLPNSSKLEEKSNRADSDFKIKLEPMSPVQMKTTSVDNILLKAEALSPVSSKDIYSIPHEKNESCGESEDSGIKEMEESFVTSRFSNGNNNCNTTKSQVSPNKSFDGSEVYEDQNNDPNSSQPSTKTVAEKITNILTVSDQQVKKVDVAVKQSDLPLNVGENNLCPEYNMKIPVVHLTRLTKDTLSSLSFFNQQLVKSDKSKDGTTIENIKENEASTVLSVSIVQSQSADNKIEEKSSVKLTLKKKQPLEENVDLPTGVPESTNITVDTEEPLLSSRNLNKFQQSPLLGSQEPKEESVAVSPLTSTNPPKPYDLPQESVATLETANNCFRHSIIGVICDETPSMSTSVDKSLSNETCISGEEECSVSTICTATKKELPTNDNDSRQVINCETSELKGDTPHIADASTSENEDNIDLKLQVSDDDINDSVDESNHTIRLTSPKIKFKNNCVEEVKDNKSNTINDNGVSIDKQLKMPTINENTETMASSEITEETKILDTSETSADAKTLDTTETPADKTLDTSTTTEVAKILDTSEITEDAQTIDASEITEETKILDTSETSADAKSLDTSETPADKTLDTSTTSGVAKILDISEITEDARALDTSGTTENAKTLDISEIFEADITLDTSETSKDAKTLDTSEITGHAYSHESTMIEDQISDDKKDEVSSKKKLSIVSLRDAESPVRGSCNTTSDLVVDKNTDKAVSDSLIDDTLIESPKKYGSVEVTNINQSSVAECSSLVESQNEEIVLSEEKETSCNDENFAEIIDVISDSSDSSESGKYVSQLSFDDSSEPIDVSDDEKMEVSMKGENEPGSNKTSCEFSDSFVDAVIDSSGPKRVNMTTRNVVGNVSCNISKFSESDEEESSSDKEVGSSSVESSLNDERDSTAESYSSESISGRDFLDDEAEEGEESTEEDSQDSSDDDNQSTVHIKQTKNEPSPVIKPVAANKKPITTTSKSSNEKKGKSVTKSSLVENFKGEGQSVPSTLEKTSGTASVKLKKKSTVEKKLDKKTNISGVKHPSGFKVLPGRCDTFKTFKNSVETGFEISDESTTEKLKSLPTSYQKSISKTPEKRMVGCGVLFLEEEFSGNIEEKETKINSYTGCGVSFKVKRLSESYCNFLLGNIIKATRGVNFTVQSEEDYQPQQTNSSRLRSKKIVSCGSKFKVTKLLPHHLDAVHSMTPFCTSNFEVRVSPMRQQTECLTTRGISSKTKMDVSNNNQELRKEKKRHKENPSSSFTVSTNTSTIIDVKKDLAKRKLPRNENPDNSRTVKSEFNAYIHSLGPDVTALEVKYFLNENGITKIEEINLSDCNAIQFKRWHGYGIIKFLNEKELQRAVDMSGHLILHERPVWMRADDSYLPSSPESLKWLFNSSREYLKRLENRVRCFVVKGKKKI